jgi:3'-phosphoadenosine 5'-phosphosulfate sulfotransferase (PAPS reductase)/FAD synthetase
MKIAVWFSCGAASAVAAKKTIELYPDADIRVLNNPVIEEHPDNLRFLKDVEKWLGKEIESVINPKYPNASAREVWAKRRYMSGVKGAPCTGLLKKEARQHWEKHNEVDYHVLGFTYDEKKRHDKFILSERDNVLPVLIDEKIRKVDCFKILRQAGIELPEIYKLGFPNANCIGCIKSSSPTYWNLVRKTFPEVYEDRVKQSREIGCRLIEVKKKRIFLDELTPETKGGKIKSWDCGTFCEEDV